MGRVESTYQGEEENCSSIAYTVCKKGYSITHLNSRNSPGSCFDRKLIIERLYCALFLLYFTRRRLCLSKEEDDDDD